VPNPLFRLNFVLTSLWTLEHIRPGAQELVLAIQRELFADRGGRYRPGMARRGGRVWETRREPRKVVVIAFHVWEKCKLPDAEWVLGGLGVYLAI
jgi:hypothetical protein